jgi:hypothetical protein
MTDPGDVSNEAGSALAALDGCKVESVVFVGDYMQITLWEPQASPRMTFNVWPRILTFDETRALGDSGYRDALCSLIGRTVTGVAESESDGLILRFDSDELVVNPEPHEVNGPEIALLQMNDEENTWAVWRPGEWPVRKPRLVTARSRSAVRARVFGWHGVPVTPDRFDDRLRPETYADDPLVGVYGRDPADDSGVWVPERLFDRLTSVATAYGLHTLPLLGGSDPVALDRPQIEALVEELDFVRRRLDDDLASGWAAAIASRALVALGAADPVLTVEGN